MSMKPGVTAQPDASSTRSPCRPGPIAVITPSAMATSSRRPAAPVPSYTVPPRMTRSATMAHDQLRLGEWCTGGGATVDGQDGATDLRGTIAGEIEHGLGHVVWHPLARQRLRVLDDRVH